mmetsp:Transcript_5324/g.6202  ORF Transcript_5324/g.6202 Transcript_5324/m.6202 type:complete len:512 (+) Transcript_5324:384-1919(+)
MQADSRGAIGTFGCFDPYLLRHFLTQYIDAKSLRNLLTTCSTFKSLILSEQDGLQSILRGILKDVAPNLRLPFENQSNSLQYLSFLRQLAKNQPHPKLACGRAHTVVIVNDKSGNSNLLTFGNGGHGELGNGTKNSCKLPQTVVIPEINERNEQIIGVTCGLKHTCLLTSTGLVYGFGFNKNKQIGLNGDLILKPTKISMPSYAKVKAIACGAEFTAVLLDDDIGRVILFGSAIPMETEVCEEGFSVLKRGQYLYGDERVVKIAAGFHHLLLLTDSGRLLSVGMKLKSVSQDVHMDIAGTHRQSMAHFTPIPIRFPWRKHRIVSIAAGEKHSALVTDSGEVYSWGSNSNGQLGHGHSTKFIDFPTKVDMKLKCNSKRKNKKFAIRISTPPKDSKTNFAVQLACGSRHTVVVMLNGKTVTFGGNAFGQTGPSPFFQTHTPEIVNQGVLGENPSYKVLFAAAGDSHTAILCQESKLVMFGNASVCGVDKFLERKNRFRRGCLLPSKVRLLLSK